MNGERLAPPFTCHLSPLSFPLRLPFPSARLKHLWHLSRRNDHGPSFRLQIDGLLQRGARHLELFLTTSGPAAGSLRWPSNDGSIATVKPKRSVSAHGLESKGSPQRLPFHRNFIDAQYFVPFARSQMRHDNQDISFDSIFPGRNHPASNH